MSRRFCETWEEAAGDLGHPPTSASVTYGAKFIPALGRVLSVYFRGLMLAQAPFDTARGSVAFGGRCQWVLDATFHVVEWLSQPLRFDSVVLRTAARLVLTVIMLFER